MAELKKCPNCGKVIMGDADTCTRCGEPISAEPTSSGRTAGSGFQKRGGRKNPLKVVLIVLAVIVVIGAVGSRNSGDKLGEPDRSQVTPAQEERQEVTDTPATTDTPVVTDVPAATEEPNAAIDAPVTPEEQAASSDPDTGDLGDYHVAIKSAILAEDYKGNPAIVITYNWTNNSEKTTSAMVALDGDAFQDGIGLETAIIGNADVHDGGAYMTEIRPGASLDVSLAYVLKNTTSVVEFELSQLISLSKDVVSMNFDPSTL